MWRYSVKRALKVGLLIASTACRFATNVGALPSEDLRMRKNEGQNPDRIQTVWEESLRLEISGNNEVIDIHLGNLTSRPLQCMLFGEGIDTELLPYGLLLKARDRDGRLLVTGDLDYWRGYWSPMPYPTDLSGLSHWVLEAKSEQKHQIRVSEIMRRVPFRDEIEDFKLMLCVFQRPDLDGYFGDTESPWIRYRPVP